ncbi:MAG: sensor histidine kinase [Bacteriovorax sp.]|nr:sensor histidine kinase [Bacteriovorax sp.]
MEGNLKYKKALIIIVCGIITQLIVLPFFEVVALRPGIFQSYVITKFVLITYFLFFLSMLHFRRYPKAWIPLFYIGSYSFVLSGQFFHFGYHFAVIEFMFICAITFEGFSFMSTWLMVLYILEYYFYSLGSVIAINPYYHFIILNALLFSWLISIFLERHVSRVKHKQGFLDRKLRYKGIKTDLLLHDVKNQLQPLIFEYSQDYRFQDILKTIQSFNSFHENHEVTFDQIVDHTKTKFKIEGIVELTGTNDFFIDQMDLQTILSNLMINSKKAALLHIIDLKMLIHVTNNGFVYEDNAGGFTEEQFKFFSQKEIQPYPGHEKNGLGILLIKKLVEYQGGKFVIKKIPNGARFEIKY